MEYIVVWLEVDDLVMHVVDVFENEDDSIAYLKSIECMMAEINKMKNDENRLEIYYDDSNRVKVFERVNGWISSEKKLKRIYQILIQNNYDN